MGLWHKFLRSPFLFKNQKKRAAFPTDCPEGCALVLMYPSCDLPAVYDCPDLCHGSGGSLSGGETAVQVFGWLRTSSHHLAGVLKLIRNAMLWATGGTGDLRASC